MIDVTQDAIQVLLDHPKGEGMIVSCYADTSVTAGFLSLWSQHLKNEASAIEQRLANDHQARAHLARDLAIIRHALEEPAVQRARGWRCSARPDAGSFRRLRWAFP